MAMTRCRVGLLGARLPRTTSCVSENGLDRPTSERLEVLGELQALTLVRGADVGAVQTIGAGDEALVDQLHHALAVGEHERHLVRADLQDGARALGIRLAVAEAGIEEA